MRISHPPPDLPGDVLDILSVASGAEINKIIMYLAGVLAFRRGSDRSGVDPDALRQLAAELERWQHGGE